MRSNWKGFYISSNLFLKVLKTRSNYRSFLSKKRRKNLSQEKIDAARKEFKIDHRLYNLRNSTIVRRMMPFSFDVYNGVLGHVTSKVRKKGKEMDKFKTLKTVSNLSRLMIGHKLGEFTFNRNFLKHTKKKKKK